MKTPKKLGAALLALLLCLSLGAAALAAGEAEMEATAEETAPEEAAPEEAPAEETPREPEALNWEDAEAEAEASLPGEFFTFEEVAVSIYLPELLRPDELTEQDREEGYIGYFTSEGEKDALAVMYVDNGLDLAGYETALGRTEGVEEVERVLVNGVPFLRYRLPEEDCLCLATDTEAGYILEFTFAPMSDGAFAAAADTVMRSIRSAEEPEKSPA